MDDIFAAKPDPRDHDIDFPTEKCAAMSTLYMTFAPRSAAFSPLYGQRTGTREEESRFLIRLSVEGKFVVFNGILGPVLFRIIYGYRGNS